MNKKVKYLLICLPLIILLLIAIFSIVKTKKDKEDKIDNIKTEEKIVKEETEEKTDIEIPVEEEKEIDVPVEEPIEEQTKEPPKKEEPKKEEKKEEKPKENKPKNGSNNNNNNNNNQSDPEPPPNPQTEPTYSCPSGYTLSGTKCTMEYDTIVDCPSGSHHFSDGNNSGCIIFSEGYETENTCPTGYGMVRQISIGGGPDKYMCYPIHDEIYTCPNGGTLSGNKCIITINATQN